jgi:hypothetical protein
MPHYLISAHSVEGEAREPMTEDEQRRSHAAMQALEADMKQTGTWVFSARLHEPDTATVVRSANGSVVTTDGPFAEAKEHLAGFYVISAGDLDEALRWATRVSEAFGISIEVRPIAAYAGTSEQA